MDVEPPASFIDYVRSGAPSWADAGSPPNDLFAFLGDTGFLAQRWSRGRRAGLRSALRLIAELAPLDGGVALAVSLHSEVFIATLARFSRRPKVAQLIDAAIEGRVVGALAITEDGGGSHPAGVATTAEERSDGNWRLRGHKRYISNLELATHCLIVANANGRDRRGPTLFIVDLSSEGVERVGTYPKLGNRSVGAWRLHLDAVIDCDTRLGPVGGGLPAILPALRYERLAVARAVTSGAQHSLGMAASYLRQRTGPSGRLFDHGALSHLVATNWVRLRSADALIDKVVDLDLARRATDADYAAVKYHCALTATEVADTALQLMGGRGYTERYPQERIWRDTRLGRIGAGTDQVMLEIVSRELDRPSSLDAELEILMKYDNVDLYDYDDHVHKA